MKSDEKYSEKMSTCYKWNSINYLFLDSNSIAIMAATRITDNITITIVVLSPVDVAEVLYANAFNVEAITNKIAVYNANNIFFI